jgi:hypothetical protein
LKNLSKKILSFKIRGDLSIFSSAAIYHTRVEATLALFGGRILRFQTNPPANVSVDVKIERLSFLAHCLYL